ncbi:MULTISPECIES: hypothetical protein [Enterobacteriaceae]|uniref:hypothetical protein n=1 Tax=Enterobacteriaceae TaxID=543 RepID=UPI001FFFAE68|nr:hypothetical protein [Escherichia coli]
MIYDVKTYYINSKTDSHLIRYDVIEIDSDTYRVKVTIDQQRGVTTPNLLSQVEEFDITLTAYHQKHNIGIPGANSQMGGKPTFEADIKNFLQEHRDRLS